MTIRELVGHLQDLHALYGDVEVRLDSKDDMGDWCGAYEIPEPPHVEHWHDGDGKNPRKIVVIR